jgi:hypothetical protein
MLSGAHEVMVGVVGLADATNARIISARWPIRPAHTSGRSLREIDRQVNSCVA